MSVEDGPRSFKRTASFKKAAAAAAAVISAKAGFLSRRLSHSNSTSSGNMRSGSVSSGSGAGLALESDAAPQQQQTPLQSVSEKARADFPASVEAEEAKAESPVGKDSRRAEFQAALALPALTQVLQAKRQVVNALQGDPESSSDAATSSTSSTAAAAAAAAAALEGTEGTEVRHVPDTLNELGKGLKLALELLGASDKEVRIHAGSCVANLLNDCSGRDIYKNTSDGAAFLDLTREEMHALKTLATSKNPNLRTVAGGVLGDFANRSGLPRGDLHLKKLLEDSTLMVESNETCLQIFAIEMAIDLASKGTIWQERLLERDWFSRIVSVVERTLEQASVVRTRAGKLFPHGSDTTNPQTSSQSLTAGGAVSVRPRAKPNNSHSSSSSSDDELEEADAELDTEGSKLDDGDSSKVGEMFREVLQFTDEQKRVLKLAFEFVGVLDLEDAEKNIKRRSERGELLERLRMGRIKLVELLTTMCSGCSLQVHLSLLKLLFSALGGLVRNLKADHWSAELEENFISSALNIVLVRAEEAASQYQFLTRAIMSNMMRDDSEDLFLEAFEEPEDLVIDPAEGTENGGSSVEKGDMRQQVYRQMPNVTASLLSMTSINGNRVSNKQPEGLLQFAESAANESRWAQAQRNAQQANHLLAKKLHLVALAMGALEVVRLACISSSAIANATVEAFEIRGVMRVLNMLYRSEVPNAKTEVAQFLHTLCNIISDQHKILLCESGVIVRLLRLASPSSVYGKKAPGGLASSDEAAFLPSIQALTCLASVDVIAARIVIAGGVGPLYSHANSTRPTRLAAKEALEALGVGNVNDLVEVWTSHRRKTLLGLDGEGEVEDAENKIEPQPLNGNTHSSHHGSENQSPGTKPGHARKASRRMMLLASKTAAGNSTKSFFSNESSRAPRSQRIHRLLKTWHRHDGSGIEIDRSRLLGDPQGSTSFQETDILGTGAFSTVYKAYFNKPGNEGVGLQTLVGVAVKKLTEAAFLADSFLEEIKILSKVPEQSNIANLFGVVFEQNTVLIVTELGGPLTLAQHLATARQGSQPDAMSPLCTSWVARLKVAIGIADALKALQSLNPVIVHLDLKSSNILITDLGNGRFVPKLCDFGLAIELKAGLEFLSPTNHGTLQYMAPEVLRNEEMELSKGFDQSADTYSFAVVLWDLAHPGRVPWDELAVDTNLDTIQDRIREMVISGRRLTCFNSESWPRGYERLIRSCWRQDPALRPSFVRSFLTDPDALSFSGLRNSKSKDVAQETICTSLKRILWDYKSTKRMTRTRGSSQFMQSAALRVGGSLRTRARMRDVSLQLDAVAPGHHVSPAKVRRQSSVMAHEFFPELGMGVDYHDHDDVDARYRRPAHSLVVQDDDSEFMQTSIASISHLAETIEARATSRLDGRTTPPIPVPRRRLSRRRVSNSVDEASLPSYSSAFGS